MLKVFLADDHQMFRQGLAAMLSKTGDIEIVGEAADGLDALKALSTICPDVAIIDIAMPGINGIELCRRIKKEMPLVKVIILTMHGDPFYTTEALEAGAHGYLLKEESFTSLEDSIKKVVNKGETVLSPTLHSHILEVAIEKQKMGEDCTINLTKREKEILQQVAEGLTNQEIAQRLFISPQTVDTHRKNLMAKLDIHSVAGLVKYALRHGYISI